jgi:hypothetical protein
MEWISVKAKPLPTRLVMVWWRGDYEFGMTINGTQHVFLCGEWLADTAGKITHWMPLPEPPK